MRIMLVCLVLFVGLFANEWKIQDDPYYKHKVSQFEVLMKKNSDINIMMLGDSITDEAQWSELLGLRVQNRGISGDTTDGVLDRLSSVGFNIKQVFIMIGVNDIMRGKSAEYVFKNYKKIVRYLQEKDIKVVIQATLYIGESRKQNFNEKIEKLNQNLEEFAKENEITFINLNPTFAPNNTLLKEFSFDDLHLNGEAYTIWANEVKKHIN